MRTLDVWLYGERVGRLEQRDGRMRFTYAREYAETEGPALSCSLRLDDEPYEREAEAFFGNLLPEGEVRTLVARRVGVSPGNDFGLLEAIGGDCAGAVTLLEPGQAPEDSGPPEVRWLDEGELAATLDELPRRPLMVDPEEGVRLSLAGAQDKLPVVVAGERVGVPLRRTPSTHILKTAIARFDDTVANEAFCLALARALGLEAANAEVREAGGRDFLLVERYDRRRVDGAVTRIHQEDFCQALAVPPQLKYEAEGGPGLAACFEALEEASARTSGDLLALLDAVVLNFAVGNHDAHGKNFSMLHRRDGTLLAPLYDIVSTAVYPGLTRKLAMAIGGEYRPEYVRRRHFERMVASTSLGWAPTRRRLLELLRRLPAAIEVAVAQTPAGSPAPVVGRIREVLSTRSGWLQRELTS